MLKLPVPIAKLQELLDAADFSKEYSGSLEMCLDVLISKKDEFAEHLEKVFLLIPSTRILLEQTEPPGHMKKLWAHWFEIVLSSKSAHEILGYLWQIGLRHVEVNLDQSYTNAAFSLTRHFIHEILERELPVEQAPKAIRAVDRLLDLCLMVETLAYIENLSYCDMDIMGGIADKVRNPVTVIGGNIRRLMKKGSVGSDVNQVYEDIIEENVRLERMVGNIKKYIELFRRESSIRRVSISEALEGALARIEKEGDGLNKPSVQAHLDPSDGFVAGNPSEIEDMFFYLFLSCLEDPGYNGGTITVSTEFDDMPARHVRIAVNCPGSTLRSDDSDKVVHPFASQSSIGTGFALPTAWLAVRKNHGKFEIENFDDKGASFVVTLPSSD